MSKKRNDKSYGLSKVEDTPEIEAPPLPYLPRSPKEYNPGIGIIGCGGITAHHLNAYLKAGFQVLALCDLDETRALSRKEAYYPEADVYTDFQVVLERDDIEVLDIATHPEERVDIIEKAIGAGKHVLSQKPFVVELETGQRLVDLAEGRGIKLAVNQNGRWAPHFSYMRHAVDQGLIGRLSTADFVLHWDHDWIADTVFNEVRHLILYDFAIHWFDMSIQLFGSRKAERVFASVRRTPGQRSSPPLSASVQVDFEGGQARFAFNGDTEWGQQDETTLVGESGTIRSVGPSLSEQTVRICKEAGFATPKLEGTWFVNGFHGTMGELLCAILEDREPANSARNNLASLELCFAAVASAESGDPVSVGEIRKLPVSKF